MRFLIFILCSLFFVFSVHAKDGRWSKHYKLVNSDIKSIENLKTRDLSLRVRLFELYGEKLNLLIEKENSLKLDFEKKGSLKKIKKVEKRQSLVLKKLESLAQKIEKQTRDITVLTKINYYRALNYSLLKDDFKFFQYIKRAEKLNSNKKMAYKINTKLADFHFNNKSYKLAVKYYKKLLYKKDHPWITKHYYNLAWSELKLSRFNAALKNLKRAHVYENKENYFKIGKQLTDAILLFYAYSQKTKDGILYIDSKKMNSFDNWIKYLHYVFENGNKKDLRYVIKRIEKDNLNLSQKYTLLAKKVLIYRTTKQFSKLQKDFGVFKKEINKIKQVSVNDSAKNELVKNIKGYTGYLQELIKSKRLITEKRKKMYVRYIAYNFNILKTIDKKNELEYSFYEGETYFSIEKYKRAAFVYALGVKKYQRIYKRNGKPDPYLNKTFDSLFKSIEEQGDKKSKVLLFSLKSYLYFYPKGEKSKIVYKRLINNYRFSGKENKLFSVLKKYNRYHPEDKKIQRSFYKELLNKYIDKKNINALTLLKKQVDKKFLGFSKKESEKLSKIITQIYFSKYETLARNGKYKEAIDGFNGLYSDKNIKYSLRVESLRKKMFYQDKINLHEELSDTIQLSLKFLKPKDKKQFSEEILFYTQNICFKGNQLFCSNLLNNLNMDSEIKLTEAQRILNFKLNVILKQDYKKSLMQAKTDNEKDFLFKVLLSREPTFSSELYKQFYLEKEKRELIDAEVNKRVLNTFYRTLSIKKTKSVVSKLSIKRLKEKILKKLNLLAILVKEIKISLPEVPKGEETTENIFSNFGQSLMSKAEENKQVATKLIDKSDPNYLPYLLSLLINKYEKEIARMKKFIPVSKNADLEEAMNNELMNIHKFFDAQLIELRSLYYKSHNKTSRGSGNKFYNENIIIKPIKVRLKQIELWQEH